MIPVFKIFNLFLVLAELGLRFCVGFSLASAGGGYSLVALLGLLIVVASLVAEHGLWCPLASAVAACGLSSCGFRALEHRLNRRVHGLSCSTACRIFPIRD